MDVVVVSTIFVLSRRDLNKALPALCFFLVLMPLEARLELPGFFDLSVVRVAILTLIAVYLSSRKRAPSGPVPLKWLIVLQVSSALCSTAYSLSVRTSAKQVLAQVIEYYLLYYILVRVISDVRTVYNIAYSMMLAIGVCCVFSLVEAYAQWSVLRVFPSNLWITYDNPTDPLYIEWGRGLRVRSTFPHPILFGDALAMTIPVSLFLISGWARGRRRLLLWLVTALMLWAIYKTSSRGPWLLAGCSFVLLFFLQPARVRRYVAALAIGSVLVMVARPGIFETISNLYYATFSIDNPMGSSYEFRHALMDSVTTAVGKDSTRMLFGYGLGTFRELGLEINFLNTVRRWYTCDNNWAVFLYETGYVGLVANGLLLITPVLLTLRQYWRLGHPARYFSGVLFIVLAVFDLGLLSVAGYSWGQQGSMAWILISLSIVYPRLVRRTDQRLAGIRDERVAVVSVDA